MADLDETPDLNKARELERFRFDRVMEELNKLEARDTSEITASTNARGLYHSGGLIRAIAEIRARKVRQLIDERITIRREMLQSFLELGSAEELDQLFADFKVMIRVAMASIRRGVAQGGLSGLERAIANEEERDAARLHDHALREIEILKREVALKMHEKEDPSPRISVSTGGGPSLINMGAIYGNVQQVIGTVSGGDAELADGLRRLAEAIKDAEGLGDERATYLEQVQFIAKQAAAPNAERQPSLVKGMVAGLRARLEDLAHLAHVLELVGPAIARHFHFPWPF